MPLDSNKPTRRSPDRLPPFILLAHCEGRLLGEVLQGSEPFASLIGVRPPLPTLPHLPGSASRPRIPHAVGAQLPGGGEVRASQ
jgi:hypothetical protein